MGLALQGGAHPMVENKFVKLEKTLGFHDFHFSNSTPILNVCEFLLYEDKDVCTKFEEVLYVENWYLYLIKNRLNYWILFRPLIFLGRK